MRLLVTVCALFVAAATAARSQAGEILNVGDPPPPLQLSSWVKGEKIDKLEPGGTYVVEFWATWCGPCRASIPHLTKLAHEYKDKGVRFLGVDVWERDTSLVKPFVDEMGDKMDYSVALDTVPAGSKPDDGAMARTWMQAAEEIGIPTAFVVHEGKIAWIGHPIRLDDPLAKITSGQWDSAATAKARLASKDLERKKQAVRTKIFTPFRAGDYKATLDALEEATSDDPELAREFDWMKLAALCNSGQVDAGLTLGDKLLERHLDNAQMLNNCFWPVIDPDLKNAPDPRVSRLALRAAERANELTKGTDVPILDTLAVARYRTADFAAAVATEEKALAELKAQKVEPNHPFYKIFEERLKMFRKAAAEAPKKS